MIPVIDDWEGNETIKYGATPVKAIIARLNDMNGGHHMDKNFPTQWAENEKYDAKTLYFVYNPWVDGKTNFSFLYANAPGNTPKRVMIDHEVVYSAITPTQLGIDFADFIQRVLSWGKTPSPYSGLWYLPYMTPWNTTLEYWWYYYPFSLQNAGFTTWDAVINALNSAQWPQATFDKVPGKVRLWQAFSSQGAGGLPGCNGHNIDLNVWPGTMTELQTWFGNVAPPTVPDILTRVQNLEAVVKGMDNWMVTREPLINAIPGIVQSFEDLKKRVDAISTDDDLALVDMINKLDSGLKALDDLAKANQEGIKNIGEKIAAVKLLL